MGKFLRDIRHKECAILDRARSVTTNHLSLNQDHEYIQALLYLSVLYSTLTGG